MGIRAWIVGGLAVGLSATAVMVASAQSGGGVPADRLAGPGRTETAVAISQHAFPDGALEVYIANNQVNPDALVGGALTKGPILLVPQCGTLPQAVADEIGRLAPLRVFALGGSAVVCDAMLQQAADAAPAPGEPGETQSVFRSANGAGTSSSFELIGGSYEVEYEYSDACSFDPTLEAVGSQGRDLALPSGNGPVTGTSFLHNVDAGEYAIDMVTGAAPDCRWKITLTSA